MTLERMIRLCLAAAPDDFLDIDLVKSELAIYPFSAKVAHPGGMAPDSAADVELQRLPPLFRYPDFSELYIANL